MFQRKFTKHKEKLHSFIILNQLIAAKKEFQYLLTQKSVYLNNIECAGKWWTNQIKTALKNNIEWQNKITNHLSENLSSSNSNQTY